ncbi:helix-turn-helix domain-containing protein, partial [Klebsiella sp. GG_Kp153]|uniref:helix-turn-helix domain-containing protein n=1 Tax=unclassified Klebsiella TaxID=2608929 RepID=UPI0032B3B102
EEVVERCRRMLENGATRQEIADVTGVGVKTIYKYFPVALTREPLCRKLQGLSEIV